MEGVIKKKGIYRKVSKNGCLSIPQLLKNSYNKLFTEFKNPQKIWGRFREGGLRK